MASEAKDSLQSQAFLQLVDLLGEGPIMGLVAGSRSIYFNETPLQNEDGTLNFNGVTTDFAAGTNEPAERLDQTQYASTPFTVGTQLKKTQPVTFAVSNPATTAVRVIISLQSLSVTNTETGDISGTSVQYKFQMSVDSQPFEDIELESENAIVKISGKSRSKYERSHMISVPSGFSSCLIRVVRLTNDSTSAYLSNDTYVDSYYEIIANNLCYPNSALMSISIDSKQFNSIPQRAYDVRGLIIRVPSNYDPDSRTYDDIWDGTFKEEWTDNPAWVLFDLLTNRRYGLGSHISDDMVDTAMLYRISQYCDELVPDGFGGQEPRFTLNTVLGTQAECYKVISDITSVFRGMSFWNGGMVGFTQDAPQDATMIFSQANVVGGMFTYTGSARKDRHSTVAVTYNDANDFFRQKVEYVEDRDLIEMYGIKSLDTLAFGTTTRGQAARVGRWILYTEKYESDFINFKVGLDSAFVVPGDVVMIHDTNRAGKRAAGRLASCTNTSAVLDAAITIDSQPATISLAMPDGSFVDRVIIESPGIHQTLTWADPLAELPLDNALWLVSEQMLVPVLARVVAISPADSGTEFEITAVEHNPSKYAAIEEGLVLEDRQTSIIDTGFVSTPTDLQVTESTYLASANTLASKLLVSWFGNCTKYVVTYRGTGLDNTSNVTTVEVSGALSYEITNTLPGDYEITVTGVNPFGKRSATNSINVTATGPTRLPSDVASLSVSQNASGALLEWTEVSDVDLMTYEVRKSTNAGGTWDAADLIIRTATPSLQVNNLTVGTQEWQVKAVNTSNSYSANAAVASLTMPQIPALTGVTATSGFLCVYINYDRPERVDFAGVRVHMSTLVNFTPSAGNLAYEGPDGMVTITKDALGDPLDPDQTYYFKVAGYSNLGKSGLNYSSAVLGNAIVSTQVGSAFLYQWATTRPSDPSGATTFDWTTNTSSGYTGGNGWSVDLPVNPGTPGMFLWRAMKQISGNSTDTSMVVDWSSSFSVSAISLNGNSGENAQLLRLSSTALAIKFDASSTPVPNPQVVTVSANLVNLTGTATFTATRYDASGTNLGDVTLGGTGNSRTLTDTQFGSAAYCRISATLGGQTDTMTVARLQDGAAGKDAISGFLTNESATVAADYLGNVSSFTGVGGTFKVFFGTAEVSPSSVAYSIVSGSASGVSVQIGANGVYSVLSMSADTGYVTLRAVYNGATIDKVFSIAKSKAGLVGSNGSNGLQAATARVYQWAASIPAGPTGTSTYTWSNGSFSYSGSNGWSTTGGTSPSAGYTLYAASVQLVDSAAQATSSISWTSATISAVGYAGSNGAAGSAGSTGAQGASYRTCYARIANNPSPTSGTITTTGGSSFPTSTQSNTTWGLNVSWTANDPDPASVNTLYQADGIYNPATGNTVWNTPYIASLKVGTLSAVTTNTGSLTVTGTMQTANGLFSVDANGNVNIKSGTTGARLELKNNAIKVYDTNGVLRVQIGDLSA